MGLERTAKLRLDDSANNALALASNEYAMHSSAATRARASSALVGLLSVTARNGAIGQPGFPLCPL